MAIARSSIRYIGLPRDAAMPDAPVESAQCAPGESDCRSRIRSLVRNSETCRVGTTASLSETSPRPPWFLLLWAQHRPSSARSHPQVLDSHNCSGSGDVPEILVFMVQHLLGCTCHTGSLEGKECSDFSGRNASSKLQLAK
jgi:hypothetical protein